MTAGHDEKEEVWNLTEEIILYKSQQRTMDEAYSAASVSRFLEETVNV